MIAKSVSYKRHRFPPEIIARAVWLYFRFPLSLRLVENLADRAKSRPLGIHE
jgi:putative transposase